MPRVHELFPDQLRNQSASQAIESAYVAVTHTPTADGHQVFEATFGTRLAGTILLEVLSIISYQNPKSPSSPSKVSFLDDLVPMYEHTIGSPTLESSENIHYHLGEDMRVPWDTLMNGHAEKLIQAVQAEMSLTYPPSISLEIKPIIELDIPSALERPVPVTRNPIDLRRFFADPQIKSLLVYFWLDRYPALREMTKSPEKLSTHILRAFIEAAKQRGSTILTEFWDYYAGDARIQKTRLANANGYQHFVTAAGIDYVVTNRTKAELGNLNFDNYPTGVRYQDWSGSIEYQPQIDQHSSHRVRFEPLHDSYIPRLVPSEALIPVLRWATQGQTRTIQVSPDPEISPSESGFMPDDLVGLIVFAYLHPRLHQSLPEYMETQVNGRTFRKKRRPVQMLIAVMRELLPQLAQSDKLLLLESLARP